MELRLGDVTTQGCDNSELTTAEHEMETFIPPVEDDCIDLGTGWSAFCQTPPVSDNERCVTYEELDKTTSKKRKKSESSEENEEEDEQPGPSSQATSPQEQKAKKSVRFSSFLKEQQEDICKGHLCVTCGDKEGTLCREKFAKGAKCILAEGRWFTPTEFEEFGGRKSSKNWKTSIRFKGKMLLVLIQEGHLNAPSRGTFQSARRSLFNIKYESETDEKEDDSCEEEDQGMGEPLSVQCGSVTAKLYKFRFASGSKGKSIRTERCWLTPSEFVQQESSITDSKWTKHILCNTRPLKYLIKKKVLQVHSALCNCELCSSENQHLLEQENDDWCLVCGRDGELVCCDTCPRSFHGLCHISRPSGGDNKWSCTFCLVENNQKDQITEQQALGRPISEYMNECQALLMKLLSEDKQRIFTSDPSTTVECYTECIKKPMWLERVKLNLQSGDYKFVREFVSDVRLIFDNCATFNKNNEFGSSDEFGAQLRKMFEEEFCHTFKTQSSSP
uniref:Nuclear body protein SP140-like protein n=1 Tax=Denticeps clupeoides TaxID=299321 RepID=A0AAY4AP76_9TELE